MDTRRTSKQPDRWIEVKYYEGDRRGCMKATVTKDELRVDLRFVTSVEDPAGSGYTERTFYVEDRHPGAVV